MIIFVLVDRREFEPTVVDRLDTCNPDPARWQAGVVEPPEHVPRLGIGGVLDRLAQC